MNVLNKNKCIFLQNIQLHVITCIVHVITCIVHVITCIVHVITCTVYVLHVLYM